MKDKVIITIELERNLNGTIQTKRKIEGEGFHYYEIIGLLQTACYDFAQESLSTAKQLPKDKEVRIKFTSDEIPTTPQKKDSK